jgi:hypothetical protein
MKTRLCRFTRCYALEAGRKMGEILEKTERAKGTDKAGRKNLDGYRTLPSNPPPTLADLGLTKRESAEAPECPTPRQARAPHLGMSRPPRLAVASGARRTAPLNRKPHTGRPMRGVRASVARSIDRSRCQCPKLGGAFLARMDIGNRFWYLYQTRFRRPAQPSGDPGHVQRANYKPSLRFAAMSLSQRTEALSPCWTQLPVRKEIHSTSANHSTEALSVIGSMV